MRAEWDFIRKREVSLADALAFAQTDNPSLSEWIARELSIRNLRRRDVVRGSRLNQTFCYQIIAGTRRASRDKLLQLAFGMRLGIDATCELLERGGTNALMPSVPRDVIVAYCLERRMKIDACDDLLWARGEQTLVSFEGGRSPH